MYIQHDHFINGLYTREISKRQTPILNPADNTLIGHIPVGTSQDIDSAVRAAQEAFIRGAWGHMSNKERSGILRNFARRIRDSAEMLGRIESLNVGKLLKECVGHDVPRAAQNIEFFADAVAHEVNELFIGEAEFLGRPLRTLSMVRREPVGVAGLIVPWNSPLMLACWKIGPCLASGNTCVVKPSPWAPLSILQLGKLANEAGIPAGVLNIVAGEAEAGDALVRHPGVNRISFTGSTNVGRIIQIANAETRFAPVSLEMGGKAPNIVFADADLDLAVQGALRSIFRSQGQSCVAGSRLLLEASIADAFTEKLVAQVRTWKIGNPLDAASELGPLINREHLERVERYICLSEQVGARLRYGGKRPDDSGLRAGNYLEPTIFDQVKRDMKIWKEEIFGPVLAIMPFSSPDEAVSLANDSPFGLSANIWTRDMEKALTVANRINAGMVWVNSHFLRDLRAPFGGVKDSGVGSEGGRYSLEFYTQPKMICLPTPK